MQLSQVVSMLTASLLLVAISRVSLAYIQTTVSTKDPQTPDRLYQDYVLWESHTETLRECSVLCTADTRCAAFTLLKIPPGNNEYYCRAYSENADHLNVATYVVTPGVVLFQVSASWINNTKVDLQTAEMDLPASTTSTSSTGETLHSGTPDVTSENPPQSSHCSSHSDCTAQKNNTACYSDTCVCSPGYYYSISSGTCILECLNTSLAASYTQYANRAIAWQDDETHSVTTVQECFDYCTNSSSCRSIDYQRSGWGSPKCYMSSTVALNMGPLSFVYLSSFDHYQRQCL